ncbi:MAG TPA: hypothetical protein VLI65_02080, partial [Pyrinomonadaceae bacterium]|nr:hypothetical protein [Pyrinomonadaceae bacterium]
LSILPEKSAWWRGSLWRYGMALEQGGKDAEALDAYIKSYSIDKPDLDRYSTVEALYKKVNGSTEGLEAKIGPSPLPSAVVVAKNDTSSVPAALPVVTATPNIDLPQATPVAQPDPRPTPSSEAEPGVKITEVATASTLKSLNPQAVPVKTPTPTDSASGSFASSSTTIANRSDAKPSTEATPLATPSLEASPTPSQTPLIEISPASTRTPELRPSPTPDAAANLIVEQTAAKTEPSPSISPTPVSEPAPTPTPVATPSPDQTPTATPGANTDQVASQKPTVEQVVAKADPTPTAEPSATPTPTPGPPVPQDPTPEPTPQPTGTPLVESTPVSIADPGSTPAKHVKTELVVTSTIPLPSPSRTPNDKIVAELTRKKPSEKPPQPKPPISTGSLFEPVVITIPKKDTTQSSERPTLEINRESGEGRPRLVDGQPVQSIDPPPCQVNVSQEKLLLLSNGGNLPVLVGVEKGYSLSDLKFVVSDPDDILVKYDPDIAGVEGRSLFVISAKSERTGNFRVTFYLPCGKKDVAITVR